MGRAGHTEAASPPRDPRAWIAALALVSGFVSPLIFSAAAVDSHEAPLATEFEARPSEARVASTILDTDALLLRLIDDAELEHRLLSVSNFALDPELGSATDKAARIQYIYHRGQAELPLSVGADLIFTSPFSDVHAQALWRRVGIPLVALSPATNLAAVRRNVEQCAQAIGLAERGERWLTWLERSTKALSQAAASVPSRRVLVIQSGYIVGAETLMDEMIRLAGLKNHAESLGIRGHAPISLTAIATNPPDFLAHIELRADEKRRDMLPGAEEAALDALQIRSITLTPRYALSTSPDVVFAAAELARKVGGSEVELRPFKVEGDDG